jgi:hypothetical protein
VYNTHVLLNKPLKLKKENIMLESMEQLIATEQVVIAPQTRRETVAEKVTIEEPESIMDYATLNQTFVTVNLKINKPDHSTVNTLY